MPYGLVTTHRSGNTITQPPLGWLSAATDNTGVENAATAGGTSRPVNAHQFAKMGVFMANALDPIAANVTRATQERLVTVISTSAAQSPAHIGV